MASFGGHFSEASIRDFEEKSRSWSRTRRRELDVGVRGGVFFGKVRRSREKRGTVTRIC
jgi:hypothetical protein